MHSTLSLLDQIHLRAMEAVSRFKRAEADLIDILQQAEEHRVFLKRGHSSLFNYVISEFGLSENVAYSLITVARKAREVPELKERIQSGEIHLSNAKRIVPLLSAKSPESNARLFEMAGSLSQRKLEKEIAKEHPEEATVEKASYVAEDRIRLELGLSEREMLKLRRVQDLLSQARRRPVSLEESIEALTSEYLKRHDPIEKAKRHQVRKGAASAAGATGTVDTADAVNSTDAVNSADPVDAADDAPSSSAAFTAQTEQVREPRASQNEEVGILVARPAPHPQREPIPAATLHQLNLRDQRRCTHLLRDGSRCNQSRWIDVHHRIPVHQSGTNDLSNLITLCSAHHRLMHDRQSHGE